MSGLRRSLQALRWAVGLAVGMTPAVSAQTIRGRVVDEANGSPVPMAGVYLLDAGRKVVSSALSDELGMYVLAVRTGGDFILRVQRLGYFETESPLLEVSGEHPYTVDLSVRPEPIRIQGLEVEVQMERQNSWANDRLRFMDPRWGTGNPGEAYGFRLITGMRLEEAKLRSKDSLDLLRWVYVPIYNSMDGMCVQMRPNFTRGGIGRAMGAHDPPPAIPQCGAVVMDGQPLQPEHVETIDFRTIHAVMMVGGTLHLMTVDFEQRFQESGRR